MQYRLPDNVHAASAGGQSFEVDEKGEINLADVAHHVVVDLVTLCGAVPVDPLSPAIPPLKVEAPVAVAEAEATPAQTAEAAAVEELEKSAAKEQRLAELDAKPLALPSGGILPPGPKKAKGKAG